MSANLYAFLCDENVPDAVLKAFPKGRARSVRDVGLVGAMDSEIWKYAREDGRIVVTANRDDFLDIARAEAARGGKNICTDPPGMLLLYGRENEMLSQFPLQHLEGRLRLEGQEVRWREVFLKALIVRAQRGRPIVEKGPRCPECLRRAVS